MVIKLLLNKLRLSAPASLATIMSTVQSLKLAVC